MSLDNSHAAPSPPAVDEMEEADKTRQAAELRRQRILDNANQRLGLVEGRPSTASSTDAVSSNGAEEATADSTTADSSVSSSAAAAASTTTSSTSSRLAAMRRRRFKTSATVATTDATTSIDTATETGSTARADESPPIDSTNATMKLTEVTTNTDEATSAETAKATTTTEGTPESSVVETEMGQPQTSQTITGSISSSAKYMGVAKMRRRMLQEKQLKQQETTTASTVAPSTLVAKKAASGLHRASTLPILMHVVTVLLLFVAGVDVGLQQGRVDYEYQSEHNPQQRTYGDSRSFLLTVHSELAPRRMGGLQRFLSVILPYTASELPVDHVKPKMAQPEWQAMLGQDNDIVDADEFDVGGSDGDGGTTSKQPKSTVDPLFQVDLDQITAGTGLYFSLARAAIRVHRLNLSIFYYGPRSLFQSITDLLWSLLQSPPVLCVAAIVLRQVVGKFVLGAKLPVTKAEEVAQKDVMTMIQNFVSSMLLNSFPTLVTFYDVWTHLRADMYVVLCGFFVGLAWSHQAQAGSMYGTRIGTLDESDTTPGRMAEAIADTLGDEL